MFLPVMFVTLYTKTSNSRRTVTRCIYVNFITVFSICYCIILCNHNYSVCDDQASDVPCLPDGQSATHLDARPGEF